MVNNKNFNYDKFNFGTIQADVTDVVLASASTANYCKRDSKRNKNKTIIVLGDLCKATYF